MLISFNSRKYEANVTELSQTMRSRHKQSIESDSLPSSSSSDSTPSHRCEKSEEKIESHLKSEDVEAGMNDAMAQLSQSVQELDHGRKIQSVNEVNNSPSRKTKFSREDIIKRNHKDAEAVHAAVFSIQANQYRRNKYTLHHHNSYHQNFGIGLGLKEPGSIPLLFKGENEEEPSRQFRRYNSSQNWGAPSSRPHNKFGSNKSFSTENRSTDSNRELETMIGKTDEKEAAHETVV